MFVKQQDIALRNIKIDFIILRENAHVQIKQNMGLMLFMFIMIMEQT